MIEEEIVNDGVHFVTKAEVEMQVNWWRFSAALVEVWLHGAETF